MTELAQSFHSIVKAQKNLERRTSLEQFAKYIPRAQKRGRGRIDLALEKRRAVSVFGMIPEDLSRTFRGLQPCSMTVGGAASRSATRRISKTSPCPTLWSTIFRAES
ncbi:MAG: hypothetical protein K0B16_08985 [Burkholderiaceae bacterium]|nr:hypothetical protein [Burkholderiaceae bacterium]